MITLNNITIPNNWLKEEVRGEYTITEEQKEHWAVMLDLAKKLQSVCEELGIKFYMDGGTLLGAVRDRGFISWDTDMDFIMRREDYEKLIEADPFDGEYYLLHTEKNCNYIASFAKLMNVNTTYITEKAYKAGETYPQGIYIDIFPVDKVESMTAAMGIYAKSYDLLKKMKEVKGDSEKVMPLWNERKTLIQKDVEEYNCLLANYYREFKVNYLRNDRDYYRQLWLPFEFTLLPATCNPKKSLDQRYRDWEHPLKIEQHTAYVLDTDKSYTEYL